MAHHDAPRRPARYSTTTTTYADTPAQNYFARLAEKAAPSGTIHLNSYSEPAYPQHRHSSYAPAASAYYAPGSHFERRVEPRYEYYEREPRYETPTRVVREYVTVRDAPLGREGGGLPPPPAGAGAPAPPPPPAATPAKDSAPPPPPPGPAPAEAPAAGAAPAPGGGTKYNERGRFSERGFIRHVAGKGVGTLLKMLGGDSRHHRR